MPKYRLTADVATYKAGQVVELTGQQAERLSGYVERLDDVRPTGVASMSVTDQAELIADYEAQLREATVKIKAQAARIAELEQQVADYAASTPAPKLEPVVVAPEPPVVEAVEEPVEQPTPEPPAPAPEPVVEEPAEQPAPEPEPVADTPEPVAEPPAAPVEQAEWMSKPTGGLNIPGSIKGRLLGAGMTTAGDVWAGLNDGRVIALDGIGDAKAADLRAHLQSLANN